MVLCLAKKYAKAFIPVRDTASKILLKTTSSTNRCVSKTVLGGKMQFAYRYHLKQGDYMTTSNLDSGYWHIPLHEEYKKFVVMMVK